MLVARGQRWDLMARTSNPPGCIRAGWDSFWEGMSKIFIQAPNPARRHRARPGPQTCQCWDSLQTATPAGKVDAHPPPGSALGPFREVEEREVPHLWAGASGESCSSPSLSPHGDSFGIWGPRISPTVCQRWHRGRWRPCRYFRAFSRARIPPAGGTEIALCLAGLFIAARPIFWL